MSLALVLALARPAVAATPAELQSLLARFDARATLPLPALDAQDLARLASGDMVKLLDHTAEGPASAVGLQILPADRKAVWISVEDPHFSSEESLTEALVARSGSDRARWYGFLDLPRPLLDRQWVIDVWNAHEVAQATGGQAWEHPWRGVEDGMAPVRSMVAQGRVGTLTDEDLDRAINTPMNEGAWVAFALPEGGTLLAYHVRFDVGGDIPEGLLSRYILGGLPKLFRAIDQRATELVPSHYRGDHAPIYGGDGVALRPYAAEPGATGPGTPVQ